MTRPSPPNVVPSRENSAWFWLIGSSWPSHVAHPFGANWKLKTRISERKGSAIARSFSYGHVEPAPVKPPPGGELIDVATVGPPLGLFAATNAWTAAPSVGAPT